MRDRDYWPYLLTFQHRATLSKWKQMTESSEDRRTGLRAGRASLLLFLNWPQRPIWKQQTIRQKQQFPLQVNARITASRFMWADNSALRLAYKRRIFCMYKWSGTKGVKAVCAGNLCTASLLAQLKAGLQTFRCMLLCLLLSSRGWRISPVAEQQSKSGMKIVWCRVSRRTNLGEALKLNQALKSSHFNGLLQK